MYLKQEKNLKSTKHDLLFEYETLSTRKLQFSLEESPINLRNLSLDEIKHLERLTNQPGIDVRDDGGNASSGFMSILAKIKAHETLPEYSLIRAYSVYGDVIGWTLFLVRQLREIRWIDAGFYVHYMHRQRGIGKKLCGRVIKYAEDNDCKHVYVQPWNATSRQFFKRLGAKYEEHRLYSFEITK